MPSNIPGNVAKYTGECPQKFQWIFSNITGNVAKHSGTGYVLKHCGECCQTFWGMSPNILENVAKHSGECPQKFQGMSLNIPGNVPENSGESKFRFISWTLACFLSNFAVKLLQNKGKNTNSFSNYWANFLKRKVSTLLLRTNLLSLITVFLDYFFFSFSLFFLCWGKRVITVRRGRAIKKSK